MELHIYDSLRRRKLPFKPLIPGRVGLYVCGITVYDYCHIGHARVQVAFDVIVRSFKLLGWFCLDSIRGRDSLPVWNRTIPLRAGWRPPGTPQA